MGRFHPRTSQEGRGNIQAVALHQLMSHFDLGWNKWVYRLTFGFPTTGIISQVGVFPHSDKAKPPISPQVMWKSSSKRFQARAARPGFKNALPLWGEAMSQAQSGWWSGPLPIDNSGRVSRFSLEGANFAFRFGVEQNEKLRARDGLKQNMANLRTSVFAPITLPTWDHISQMARHIYNSKVAWGFFKADRKDAYKQLLLDQEYVNIT